MVKIVLPLVTTGVIVIPAGVGLLEPGRYSKFPISNVITCPVHSAAISLVAFKRILKGLPFTLLVTCSSGCKSIKVCPKE
ncbi:hypothetical protein D3C80_1153030 [compost metagenome]